MGAPRGAACLREPALWLLVMLFAAEFALFDSFGSRRHTIVYPRWNDQIQYLSESYAAYERARARGFIVALDGTLTNPSAQGTLHDMFALFAFLLAGPSRSAALALNMLALLAWQTALFLAISRASGSRWFALACAMLPAALAGPWENVPGSAYDFRLDHLAMCAIGVTASAAVLSDGFRSRRGSLTFGAALGVTLLTRFLTGAYFALILVALAAWLFRSPERRPRLANFGRALILATVIAGPLLWLNRAHVFDYYWVGHFVGPESGIRSQSLNLWRSFALITGTYGTLQLGAFFGALAVLGTVAWRFARGGRLGTPATRDLWIVAVVFLVMPTVVFTLHQQKSHVVFSAMAPGTILLVAALWLTVAGRASPRTAIVAATGIALACIAFFAQRQLRPAYDAATLADIRRVNTIADTILQRTTAAKLPRAHVAVDYVSDCLDAQVLRVVCYERHRVWLPLEISLPTGIGEPAEADVMRRLEGADFVFLTEQAGPGHYPYDRKLAAMAPVLRAWCDTHLKGTDRFELFGRRMALYQKPTIPFAASAP